MLWIFFLIAIFIMLQKNAFDQKKFQISCTGSKVFSKHPNKVIIVLRLLNSRTWMILKSSFKKLIFCDTWWYRSNRKNAGPSCSIGSWITWILNIWDVLTDTAPTCTQSANNEIQNIIYIFFFNLYRTYVKVQQTPNPAAQFPSTVPLLLEHSVSVIQVPYIVESEVAVHWL